MSAAEQCLWHMTGLLHPRTHKAVTAFTRPAQGKDSQIQQGV